MLSSAGGSEDDDNDGAGGEQERAEEEAVVVTAEDRDREIRRVILWAMPRGCWMRRHLGSLCSRVS